VIYVRAYATLPEQQVDALSLSSAQSGDPTSVRNTLLVLGIAWIAGVTFWAAYGQIGSTVALWADAGMDRTVRLGDRVFTIPPTWFQALNPLFVFLLAPLISGLWAREAGRQSTARELSKLATGGVLLAVSFGMLAAVSASGDKFPSWLWLVAALAPFTAAELYFTPVGMGLFSRLALRGRVALFVSLWSVAMMAGYAASGWVGHLWDTLRPSGFFLATAVVALAATVVITIARPFNR
jgi:POT family proton-dependent oligopeptide transporter